MTTFIQTLSIKMQSTECLSKYFWCNVLFSWHISDQNKSDQSGNFEFNFLSLTPDFEEFLSIWYIVNNFVSILSLLKFAYQFIFLFVFLSVKASSKVEAERILFSKYLLHCTLFWQFLHKWEQKAQQMADLLKIIQINKATHLMWTEI